MKSKVLQRRQQLLAAVLELVEEMVAQVEKFGIQIKDKYPKDYKKFKKYVEGLKPHNYTSWCSFVGCLVSPMSYTEGNNHLVVFDNGLFSDYLGSIPTLHYSRESALLTHHIFGLNRRVHPIGGMHIHIINTEKFLENNNSKDDRLVFDLKKIIDSKHEHMEDKNYRLVVVSHTGPTKGELVTVEGWQFRKLLLS